MTRREFLKKAFLAGVPLFLNDYEFLKDYNDYGYIMPVKNQRFARILSCTDAKCVTGNFSIDKERATELFKKALLEYTRKPAIPQAAQSLFPQFRENLRVSIKVNTASWDMPSHYVIAEAIAACLVEGGLKPDNIIIWERAEKTFKDGGYHIRNEPGKIKFIATDTKGYGYDQSYSVKLNGIPVYLTSIITRHSDFLVNLSPMKHHLITGITSSLKNMYGAIPLLDEPIMAGPWNMLKMHLHACNPYISEINAAVSGKVPTILYICDGLVASWEGGPWGPPQWIQNEILLGNDPVAIDTTVLYRIEMMRKKLGLSPVLAKSKHIHTSAEMGLGTNDPEHIDFNHVNI